MKKLLLFAVLISSSAIFSQKAKVQEGDWSNLKGITEYNLVFDYSNLEIPKFDSEEDFLEDKMSKREEKEAGKGEEFKELWFSDRENFYEPRFIETFNDRYKNNLVKVDKNLESAEYTMKVHTTLMYSGYNVGIVRKNSKIEVTLSVYKNDSPENIIFSVNYTRIEGEGNGGFDFNSGQRIADAYIIFARALVKDMYKKTK
ncbi:hypothetical protein BZARG_2054 [Bizionia argentinensis JUB59]|uniref:Uncharacterized protein n=1 Tax=Bizionia argentinensis JUB59 TaxID=1046627 RepID=G2EFC0_9FLAO|nr:hypothetical protein [Bizionia argentinensis]EGV42892.1 hypothetical protein BZARG_2054 [Bizionia argentinensis JUB59]